jgi:hypothetical protein
VITSSSLLMASTAASVASSRPRAIAPEDQEVAAANGVGCQSALVFDHELAVHCGYTPEAAVAELLGRLPAVAEEARAGREAERGRAVEAVVAGRARAREDALADAVAKLRHERIRREAEHQHAHAGPPVGRLVGRKRAIDTAFRAAADDGGAEARHHLGRNHRPLQAVRRDHESERAHSERLGERIVDRDAVYCLAAHN